MLWICFANVQKILRAQPTKHDRFWSPIVITLVPVKIDLQMLLVLANQDFQ